MATGETAPPAVLRTLTEADLLAASALTGSFHWPHRLQDWAFMLGLGEGVAAERDGTLVATGMLWPYGRDHAGLGMVGVSAGLQGQGLGRQVMQNLLHRAGSRSVTLFATAAGEGLYGSLGFVTLGAARQLQGAAGQSSLQALPAGERLRPTGHSDPAALMALDRQATGLDRKRLVTALLEAGTAVVLDRAGTPLGFAILRRFGHGHVIGPVVAPDEGGARALISHFLNLNPGQFIRLDVPVDSGLVPWLLELGLADAGEVLQMVRGALPRPGGPGRRFALVSQGFG